MIIKNLSKDKKIIKKIESDINVISCSGGDDNLGHPAVYYNCLLYTSDAADE